MGSGYNILKDRPMPAQIMRFETKEDKYGFVLPTCATLRAVNQTRHFTEKFQSKDFYIR